MSARLFEERCAHGAPALDDAAIAALLRELPEWRVENASLTRSFTFAGWLETLAFVNALGWLAHGADHHPVLTVEYRSCTAAWTTHSAGNRLSMNDFVCAARADALYAKGGA